MNADKEMDFHHTNNHQPPYRQAAQETGRLSLHEPQQLPSRAPLRRIVAEAQTATKHFSAAGSHYSAAGSRTNEEKRDLNQHPGRG